jgi:hypothetical protein
MLKNNIVVVIAGALLAYFVQQAWWIRGIEGAFVGFTAFVTIPVIYSWARGRLS